MFAEQELGGAKAKVDQNMGLHQRPTSAGLLRNDAWCLPPAQGTSPSTVSERRTAGLNTHAADLESVVEANRPLEEEPREGRPARILDECGQGPELRGLAR